MVKMVNGSRYYRALESVSIASALSTALTIYPCQIRVHQRWQSKLQLPTARKKEWWPATADSVPQAVTCQHRDTHYFSRPRTHNLPIVGPTSVTDSTTTRDARQWCLVVEITVECGWYSYFLSYPPYAFCCIFWIWWPRAEQKWRVKGKGNPWIRAGSGQNWKPVITSR